MSKSFVIGFVFGLCLLGIAGAGASRQDGKQAAQYQAEIVDATPVQRTVLTENQRFHSRLHNGFGQNPAGKPISQWIASEKGQKEVLGRYVNGKVWLPSGQPELPSDYFGRFAHDSDAIVRGQAINKNSQITEDDSFLFTDYEVVIREVFKNSKTEPINVGSQITVTCLGGKVVLDDVIMKAGGNGVSLLPVNAQDVLLFLRFIPETGGYKLAEYNGAFELNGNSVRPLAGLFPITPGFFDDEPSFLKTIKDVSNR
ncbi:MAG: hypothetical protein AABO41_16860 [Acidobacteriota bacterium]